jgi:hypothetical protein
LGSNASFELQRPQVKSAASIASEVGSEGRLGVGQLRSALHLSFADKQMNHDLINLQRLTARLEGRTEPFADSIEYLAFQAVGAIRG